MENIKIPTHLALILDGNGRWASSQGKPRTFGHKAGVERLKDICKYASKLGIYAISAYCFSTENWKRDIKEVEYLFSLPIEFLPRYINDAIKDDVKIIFSGDISKLPPKTFNACLEAINKTKDCKSHVLNICFNYGSHDEILKATKEIAKEVKENKISVEDINKELFESFLYTKDLPPVDLLIRTAGEIRLSNYLLWQVAYAEFYFAKVTWPEFTCEELDKALIEFTGRDRKFGGINK